MGDEQSSASYIHMVHRLIEECILFNMTKEECVEALSKHANIKPVITSTVWNELEKVNKEFFEAYKSSSRGGNNDTEVETRHKIQSMITDPSKIDINNKKQD